MLLAFMNDPWKNVLDEAWLARQAGFEAFELAVEHPNATPEKLAAEGKRLAEELAGFRKILAHSSWYFSLAHPYPSIRKAFVRETLKAAEAAAGFGARLFTIHIEPFHFVYKEKAALAGNYFESVGEIAAACEGNGLVLCVEGFEEASFPLEKFRELFKEFPKVRMTFDIGHANLIAPNSEGIFRVMREFRKEIAHVHAHDNKGKTDDHLPIGAGRIPWEAVLARLKEFYDGTITVEDHSPDRDLMKRSREKLARLWKGA
ncbi:MAG: sugar phosphate isomerase/epimerase family protein [Candidatus Micrarchaeia archaeon]